MEERDLESYVGKRVDVLVADGISARFNRRLLRIDAEKKMATFDFYGQEETMNFHEIEELYDFVEE